MESIKQNLSPGIWGAIIGAVALAIVGFNWGGWVTASTAKEMAQMSVVEQLVPICVGQFNMDSDKAAKLVEMKKESSWAQKDFVMKQGWATMPGSKEANRDVAGDCADLISA